MRLRPLVRALRRGKRPVLLGSLGSTQPVSWDWGFSRGLPIDRWYIERFLERHRKDITGRVLEVKDSGYTDRFGHDVVERAILDVDAANRRATHVADLAQGEGLPSETFDCFVLTQTLQYIFDVRAALAHAHRTLRPGGVLLVTLPVTSKVSDPPDMDYWRFTPEAATRLLADAFGTGAVTVTARGNVLTQVAFLKGLAVEDLTPADFEFDDERFPLIVCARAVREP
jgi:SAM-dependent methyltransferase